MKKTENHAGGRKVGLDLSAIQHVGQGGRELEAALRNMVARIELANSMEWGGFLAHQELLEALILPSFALAVFFDA